MVQWLRLHLPMQGVWVQSLVGELRPYMPKNQDIKQRQCSNEYNKDFKNSICKKKKKFWMAVWLPLSARMEGEGPEMGSAELETWGRE